MYSLRILDTATRELADLDRQVAIRIAKRLQWLAENIEEIRPLPLSGDLSSFYKFRVGDYRVIYEILSAEQTLVIHAIGHRREIYRPR
ncbi:MAG: type II toxin-antitoxin system RelE family toxin [Thermoanaerobaculia bacterium]